jgi:ABC-type transporter Mla MlaB component
LSQLDGAGAAGIDGAEVTQVDGAGLQLLLSLVQTIEARGASVRWTGVSDTLLEGARTLGLVEALRLQPSGASA